MSLLVEGRTAAAETAHRQRAWLAYTTAALGRAKKLPSLKDVIGKPRREPARKIMGADQMLTIARMWTAATTPRTGD